MSQVKEGLRANIVDAFQMGAKRSLLISTRSHRRSHLGMGKPRGVSFGFPCANNPELGTLKNRTDIYFLGVPHATAQTIPHLPPSQTSPRACFLPRPARRLHISPPAAVSLVGPFVFPIPAKVGHEDSQANRSTGRSLRGHVNERVPEGLPFPFPRQLFGLLAAMTQTQHIQIACSIAWLGAS